MKGSGLLIVISGFSGSGKGTIMKELIARYPEEYALSISATTRGPREGLRYLMRKKLTELPHIPPVPPDA